MSSENVEHVRTLLEEWNRGDVEALIMRMSEDFEWHPALVTSVEGRIYSGHDGFREFIDEWSATWESWELEAEDMREIGDQVLVLTHVRAKGRGSGVAIDEAFAHLFEFRDGLICRAQTFFDRGEAIAFAENRRTPAS